MVGPLSLVNHSCEAPYGFTFPSNFLNPATFSVVTDFSAVRKRDLIRSSPSTGHLVYNEEYSRPSRGEEIFVNYGDSLGFTCLCTGCQQSTVEIDGQVEGVESEGSDFSSCSSIDEDFEDSSASEPMVIDGTRSPCVLEMLRLTGVA